MAIENKKPKLFYGWIVVICGVIILGVTYGIVYNCFSLFIIPVTEHFGFTREKFSIAISLLYFVYMITSLVSGKVYKYIKVKTLLLVTAVALPVTYFLFSISSKLWHYYVICSILGGLIPFVTMVAFAVIVANWFVEKRGLALGVTYMGSGLGGMVLNMLGGNWLEKFGFVTTFRIYAAIMAAVSIPLVFLFVKVSPEEKNLEAYGLKGKDTPSEAIYGPSFTEALKNANFWMLVVMALFIGYSTTMLAQTIVTRITDFGYSANYAANINAGYLGGLCLGKVVLGILYDKMGMKKSCIISLSCVVLGLIGLFFCKYQAAHFLIVIGAGLGCASGTVAYPLITKITLGTRDYATICGIATAASAMGGTLAPTITNAIFDKTGSYDFAIYISLCLIAIAIFLSQLLKRIEK